MYLFSIFEKIGQYLKNAIQELMFKSKRFGLKIILKR